MKNDEICSQDNQQWRGLRKFSKPPKTCTDCRNSRKIQAEKESPSIIEIG